MNNKLFFVKENGTDLERLARIRYLLRRLNCDARKIECRFQMLLLYHNVSCHNVIHFDNKISILGRIKKIKEFLRKFRQ